MLESSRVHGVSSRPRDPGSTALFHVGDGLHGRQLAEHHRCRLFPPADLHPPPHRAQEAVRVLVRMRRLEALEQLPVRLLARGEEANPVEDGKTVRGRVDAAKAEQRARPAYKPPPDHPRRRPFKPAAGSVTAG